MSCWANNKFMGTNLSEKNWRERKIPPNLCITVTSFRVTEDKMYKSPFPRSIFLSRKREGERGREGKREQGNLQSQGISEGISLKSLGDQEDQEYQIDMREGEGRNEKCKLRWRRWDQMSVDTRSPNIYLRSREMNWCVDVKLDLKSCKYDRSRWLDD